MADPQSGNDSPKWGSTTKLVVGMTVVALMAALLIRFRVIIGPLILAFILAYLLHPLGTWINRATRISWRTTINLIYLVVVIIVGSLFAVAGLAVVQQVQSLVSFVQRFVTQLPDLVSNLATQTYQVGPLVFDPGQFFDLQRLTDQLLSIIQPLLGQLGGIIRTFAGSAANMLGWGVFILLISYFILADTGSFPNEILHIELPGYNQDIRRLGRELRKIWNSFLRGQLIITTLVMILYSILMFVLGIRYAIGIAILAGLSRFIPYIGPLITLSITALVAFLQSGNHFGLAPVSYAVLVVVISLLLDQIIDNLISPRFFSQALGVHPAAILVAAIIAANLIGIIGLILAAPVLATLTLLGRYIFRKMLDLDPWTDMEEIGPSGEMPWMRWFQRFNGMINAVLRHFPWRKEDENNPMANDRK